MTSPCGPLLADCRCATRPGPRTPAQIQQLHTQARARAHWSGWANQPVPADVLATLGVHARNDWWKAAA